MDYPGKPNRVSSNKRDLFARELTIAGGTIEMQRNIIGEHVLGLPKG